MKKDRGKFLTIMIGLAVYRYLANVYKLANPALSKFTFGLAPGWFPIYSLIISIVGIISVIGIWKFKKWGVYSLIGLQLVGFFVLLFTLRPENYPNYTERFQTLYISSFVLFFIEIGLWVWAISRKWRYFS